MLVYSALIPSQLEEALNITPSAQDVYDDIKGPIITIPILIGVVLLVLIGLSIKISAQFGWSVFKLLGASLHIKKLFFYYQILVTLLLVCFHLRL